MLPVSTERLRPVSDIESGQNLESSWLRRRREDDGRVSVLVCGKALKGSEILILWLGQMNALFAVASLFAVHFGKGGYEWSTLGERANVMIVYTIACTFLYREAGIEERMTCAERRHTILFVSLYWFSALAWSILQNHFRNVNVSVASIHDWTALVWILVVLVLASISLACVKYFRQIPHPWWREALPWLCLLFYIVCLAVGTPNGTRIHLHHWQSGSLVTLLFRKDGMRGTHLLPMCVQACGLGVFVHGISAFGFGSLFQPLPECD
eukprot:TRINITY_DN25819_c0_g3_i1.p1 TRINITY_DN25819_c0_g3~~TRINITY_DN25819_c0_g3_i1.p1  ORF type:complete len:267 (-),score=23.58 TRINITY_DN25819_c0_g3_i1:302-1102(-)